MDFFSCFIFFFLISMLRCPSSVFFHLHFVLFHLFSFSVFMSRFPNSDFFSVFFFIVRSKSYDERFSFLWHIAFSFMVCCPYHDFFHYHRVILLFSSQSPIMLLIIIFFIIMVSFNCSPASLQYYTNKILIILFIHFLSHHLSFLLKFWVILLHHLSCCFPAQSLGIHKQDSGYHVSSLYSIIYFCLCSE